MRLSVKNATTLWKLVKEKMANTTVVLHGTIPNIGPMVTRARPLDADGLPVGYIDR
jgi:hypothetical protein